MTSVNFKSEIKNMSVIEIKVPSVGESITEVTLSQWLKKDGDFVQLDEFIGELESDKATMELPSTAAGKITWVAKEGQDLKIGDVVATIDTSATNGAAVVTPPAATPEAPAKPEPAQVAKENYATGTPAPAAAKILRESDIPATQVEGTGKDGRITKADALAAVENKPVVSTPAAPPAQEPKPAAPVTSSIAFSRDTRREKMSRMRRTIAKRLVSAKNNTAMLTTFNEVDLSALMAMREKYQERFVKKYGIKLGFMSLFAKACAKALKEMPDVNAMIDGDDIVYHDFVDISIAISTPTGLVVPPVHNVESLGFHEIEFKIKALAEKAKNGKLTTEEMAGGTFTITNGGIFGSLMSTPILNEPQSAILGMHAIKERPIVVDGQVVVRPMMYLALSYDHRVIDGSTSVTFLVRVKELIEDPVTLLMDI